MDGEHPHAKGDRASDTGLHIIALGGYPGCCTSHVPATCRRRDALPLVGSEAGMRPEDRVLLYNLALLSRKSALARCLFFISGL